MKKTVIQRFSTISYKHSVAPEDEDEIEKLNQMAEKQRIEIEKIKDMANKQREIYLKMLKKP